MQRRPPRRGGRTALSRGDHGAADRTEQASQGHGQGRQQEVVGPTNLSRASASRTLASVAPRSDPARLHGRSRLNARRFVVIAAATVLCGKLSLLDAQTQTKAN
jgi:hypothetical protein